MVSEERPALADDAMVRATFDGAPDGLVVMNDQGRQIAFNAAFVELWQFPPDMQKRRSSVEMRDHVARQLKDPQAYLDHVERMGMAPSMAEFEHLDGRVFDRKVAPLASAGYPHASVVRWRDITARRQTERALRTANARLAAVFDFALNAILLTDDQGRYIEANPSACALLGRSRDQLCGLSVADVMDLPRETAADAWQDFLRQGAASGEARLRRPDGSVRHARFSAVANIQPGVHLSVLTDATDELQARQRELETAAQMDLAMANADIVFFSIDLVNDGVSATNPERMQQMLGYSPDELPARARDWDALVHPEDRGRREASWETHLVGQSARLEVEFRMRHKDGHWVWLLSRGRATARDAQGRATRVVGMRMDITRRKLAEQQLEAQAFTDSLTGVLNRRRFLELAAQEVERAHRYQQPLTLLMIDLDHFKSVNDGHGHAGGDAVLRAFVHTAQTVMRSSDLFGRVGGEEFAALLPQTDLDGAACMAMRLRAEVRNHPVVLPTGTVDYSISIGVAAHDLSREDGITIEAMMLEADGALYRAKGEGRDRVLLARPRTV